MYFFQTQGEIDQEIDTDYRNKYDIFTSLVIFGIFDTWNISGTWYDCTSVCVNQH